MYPFLTVFSIKIPMYGLMVAIGFLACSFLSWYRTKRRGMQGENLIIIAAMLFLFALMGGILFYDLITYGPGGILDLIREGNWKMLLRGGIIFYGAAAGGVIGALIGSRIAKEDIRDYLDIIVPTIPLGHAIGRIGCFCAGCCYGRPTDSVIGVIYTNPVSEAPVGVRLLPIQLMESGINLILFGILMVISGKKESRYLTSFLYCILYGVARFILEFFRYDSIRGFLGGLSTSQWISLGLIAGALITGTIYKMIKKTR